MLVMWLSQRRPCFIWPLSFYFVKYRISLWACFKTPPFKSWDNNLYSTFAYSKIKSLISIITTSYTSSPTQPSVQLDLVSGTICQLPTDLRLVIQRVGGVAQWLERRSLTGELSLIYGWHVTTSWVKCPLWVTQPGQLSLPSLLCR